MNNVEIKKAIIPLAGLSTRFLPLSKVVSKELWPLVDLPMFHYVIEEARNSGIEEFIFVLSPDKKKILDYLKPCPKIEKILKDRKKEEVLKEVKKIEEVYIAEDTLVLSIEDIGVSFFKYPYPLIRSYQKINNILIASPEDIAAMKILAISQRGRRRDFIDIYFLMQKFTVNQMMGFVKEKYPMFNIYLGLQGLTYFADADQDPEKGRYRLLKKVKWNEIKKFIIGEVNRFKTRYLKK